ncbi:GSCFA domain-containing protein [uncultured Tateyamaria sp.]|uniref:GSCFA domain-containing protein n=1 Tax=uncultured Tateyamaria sp. TaxID=455651 RepID=UPI002632F198|nr:GSCFA domain-containing protein [uncultured Tateyamaria sp.]
MPYSSQQKSAFWKICRDSQDFLSNQMFRPKRQLKTGDQIATAGSCFAQNIGAYIKKSDLTLVDVEPAPYGMPPDVAKRYGYDLFSARYGNIYTARQLRQLLTDAVTGDVHKEAIWGQDGAFFDGLRPGIEPHGYASVDALKAHRRDHLDRVRSIFETADMFIFTLGLTEAWQDTRTGLAFPTAPGVVAGTYDPARHSFVNFRFNEVVEDMNIAFELMRDIAPDISLLLTVSPVPLTATATDTHVLAATTYSKSVLRAAAEELALSHPNVDYFPSYELVCGVPFVSGSYTANLRTVGRSAVDRVMSVFFEAHAEIRKPDMEDPQPIAAPGFDDLDADDALICEEMLLEVFADK